MCPCITLLGKRRWRWVQRAERLHNCLQVQLNRSRRRKTRDLEPAHPVGTVCALPSYHRMLFQWQEIKNTELISCHWSLTECADAVDLTQILIGIKMQNESRSTRGIGSVLQFRIPLSWIREIIRRNWNEKMHCVAGTLKEIPFIRSTICNLHTYVSCLMRIQSNHRWFGNRP